MIKNVKYKNLLKKFSRIIFPLKHLSERNRKIAIVSAFFVLLVTIPIVFYTLSHLAGAEAAWFDTRYAFRQRVDITNAGSAQTDFQVSFTLNTSSLVSSGKMRSDCYDIRITDVGGNVLPHWIEEGNPGCNSTTTTIWTKMSSISTTGNTLYVYYGNPQAKNAENPNNVFVLFDTFNGSTLDGSKWSTTGSSGTYSISVSGGKVTLSTSTVSSAAHITTSKQVLPDSIPFAWEQKFNVTGSTGTNIRDRFYLATTPGGTKPTTGNHDYGIFSQATGPQPQVFWNGNTGTAVTTSNEIKHIQSLDGTNFTYSLTDLSSQTSIYSNSNAQASTDFRYLRTSATRDGSGTATSQVAIDWVFVRKTAATAPSVGSPTNEEHGPAPIAWWKLDEGTGITAKDSTTNNISGTLSGSTLPSWQTKDQCVSDRCLYFNGSTSYVTMGDVNSHEGLSAITINAWVKLNALPPSSQYFIAGKELVYKIDVNSNGTVRFLTGNNWGGATLTTSNSLATNTWYHIVATYDGTTKKIFINGIQDPNTVTTSGSLNTNSRSISIGAYDTGAGFTNYIPGFIDEVKIYKYAQSLDQVKSSFNKYAHVLGATDNQNLSNGLIGYWKMDESDWTNDCSTTSVTDSSGNGYNGKSCPSTTGPDPSTTAKFGTAANLDGSNDYIDLVASSNFIPSTNSPITVSAWVRPTAIAAGNFTERVVGIASSSTLSSFIMGFDNSNQAFFYDGVTRHQFSGTYSTNTWHYMTVTFDGSNARLYMNGVQDGSPISTSLSAGHSTTAKIGVNPTGAGSFFNGQIDEVRIYNRALSATELAQLYNFSPAPVGYWNMDEASGSILLNRGTAGSTINGSMTGAVYKDGKYGRGISTDGSSTYASIPDDNSIDFDTNQNFTVNFWMKDNGGNATTDAVVEKWAGSAPYPYVFRLNGSSVDFRRWDTTNNPAAIGTKAVNDSGWHHVAGVKDGSVLYIYIDGILSGQANDTTSGTTVNASTVGLGRRQTGTNHWNGQLDELKIYNYALTAGQVVEDMNAGHPAPGSPIGTPVAHWKFNEGYGTVTGNSGFVATVSGSLVSTSWTNDGKLGKALSFDGSASYVSVAKMPAFYPKEVTSSAWIYPTSVSTPGNIVSVSGNLGWRYRINTNRTITFFDRGATNAIISTDTIPLNTWSHVAVVGGFNGLRVYFNGNLVSSNSTAYGGPVPSTGNVVVGAFSTGTLTENFAGKIDEVKIFNSALTASQIKLEYNNGQSLVLGALSDTSGLTSGNVASNSASAEYCVPGDTTSCASPVGRWSFEEKQGTSANDSSGNANTGTLSGNTYWTKGKYGTGLNFDGNGDIVTAGTGSSISITGAITVEAWVNVSALPASNKGYSIVAKDKNTGGRAYTLDLLTSAGCAGTCFRFYISGGGNLTTNEVAATTNQVQANKWYHVVGTYIPSTSMHIYVNGILADTNTVTSPLASIPTATANLTIGGREYAGVEDYFNGTIDEPKIFNYSRSASQIAWDYNKGKPVGHWKFDECQGSLLNDSSGKSNSATLTIGASGTQTTVGTCSTSGAWANGAGGKFNYSMNFDGTDDYIVVNDNPSLDIGSQITLAGWFKVNDTTANRALISKQNEYLVRFNTDDTFSFYLFDGVDYEPRLTAPTNPSAGTWHHFAAVYDSTLGSNHQKIYINGVLVAQQDRSITTSGTSNALHIGRFGTDYFDGQLDDMKVYNYALTKQQIKTLMNQDGAVRYGPSTGAP
jgi:hypothetical protein